MSPVPSRESVGSTPIDAPTSANPRSSGLAAIAKSFPPKKDKGQASKRNWNTWSNDMSEHSIALAKAAAKKGGAEVKTIASKLNASCSSCHLPFKGK